MAIMQPNQQDPNQQGATPPSAPQPVYNVPDYLHLDPIPDPSANQGNKKKVLLISVFIALFVVLAIALGIYIYKSQAGGTVEDKLYRALENTMKSDYVVRNYEAKLRDFDLVTTATMTIKTDASNPAVPKSDIQETYSQKEKQDVTDSFVGQFRTFNDTEQHLMLSEKAETSNAFGDIAMDQWYVKQYSTQERTTIGYALNRIETPRILNSIQGILIAGGVEEQSKQLVDFIKSSGTYPILKTQSESNGNEHLTRYDIQVDHDKLNNLNKKAVELLGIKQRLVIMPYADQSESLSLWVDDTTEKIVKMTYVGREIANNKSTDKTTKFDYPTTLSIETPNNSKKLSS
jgi:hypothetical protein